MTKRPSNAVKQLRSYMLRLGLNQTRLAEAVDVDSSAVTRWLSGERRPRLDVALRIEKVTGVQVEAWWPSAT